MREIKAWAVIYKPYGRPSMSYSGFRVYDTRESARKEKNDQIFPKEYKVVKVEITIKD